MSKFDWIGKMAGKLLPGRSENKAVADAGLLWNLRNHCIAIASLVVIIALIIFLPKIIIDEIVENNKEFFCDHTRLDYSHKKYDYDTMTVTYGCSECNAKFNSPMTCTENVIKEVSCTDPGEVERIYTVEGHSQLNKTVKVTVEQLPHTYEVLEAGFMPTCEEKGLTDYRRCTVCNWHFPAEDIDATGHTSVTLIPYKAPTCTEDGNVAKTQCSVCKTILCENYRIPTVDHKYEMHSTVAPTDYETGYDLHKCIWCSKTYQDNYVSPLKQELTFRDDYSSCYLARAKTEGKVLVIPEYNGNLPVRSILCDAVSNMDCVEEVIIPKTVDTIQSGAFKNLPNLKKIHFADGLKKIETGAFQGCPEITAVEFPASLEYLEMDPFPDSKKIYTVAFSEESKPYVESYTFSKCVMTMKLPAELSDEAYISIRSLPVLAEIYATEELVKERLSSLYEEYIIKQDYSEESSIIKDGDNFYAEINGECYFIATLTEEKYLTLPETINGKRYLLRRKSLSLVIESIDSITVYSTITDARAAIGTNNSDRFYKVTVLNYTDDE